MPAPAPNKKIRPTECAIRTPGRAIVLNFTQAADRQTVRASSTSSSSSFPVSRNPSD